MKPYRLFPCITAFTVSALLAQTPQMALPDGNGAWTVHVVTSGGILGTGIGDFAISSEGRIICTRTVRCPKVFQTADFQSLIETIQAGTPAVPFVPAVSLCSDCITRTITIIRRDAMGVVHTYTASWNDISKEHPPQDVTRIYDAIIGLTK